MRSPAARPYLLLTEPTLYPVSGRALPLCLCGQLQSETKQLYMIGPQTFNLEVRHHVPSNLHTLGEDQAFNALSSGLGGMRKGQPLFYDERFCGWNSIVAEFYRVAASICVAPGQLGDMAYKTSEFAGRLV